MHRDELFLLRAARQAGAGCVTTATSALRDSLLVVPAEGVSERLTRWVRRHFAGGSAERVLETLSALPEHVAPWGGPPRERIQAALVLRTGSDWQRFQGMLRLAQQDWRDALVAADLADEDWRDPLDANLN